MILDKYEQAEREAAHEERLARIDNQPRPIERLVNIGREVIGKLTTRPQSSEYFDYTPGGWLKVR